MSRARTHAGCRRFRVEERWIQGGASVGTSDVVASKVTTEEHAYWTSGERSSATGPALLSHAGRLWVAWAGSDGRVNLMGSPDGVTFDYKVVLDERTAAQPSLAVHDGRLALAWTGGGNRINVAMLTF